MQACGRLIEQEQGALLGNRLFAGSGRFGSTRQEPSQLQTLRLAARQGGHRLAQLHVFKAHIHDGLQGANHIAVLRKQGGRFADREVQHIGHIQVTCAQITNGLTLNGDFQNFGAISFAIAIGATQIHVAQELHFHVFKARTAASGAAAIATVETELGRRVAALLRQRCDRKNFAQCIPCAHITHGVGACCFADG